MRSKPTLDEYLSTNIEIKDGVLSSSLLDISIMDDQETLIMEESAKVICKNGGDILNVGFGLGIIDSYIQQHKIKSHTIIEIHPGVIQHAKNLGFDKKARLCQGDWRVWISKFKEEGKKFDGIYFDTYNITEESNEWADFAREVDSILKPGGIFSYFNNTAARDGHFMNIMNSLPYSLRFKRINLKDIEEVANKEINKKSLQYRDYSLIWRIKQK